MYSTIVLCENDMVDREENKKDDLAPYGKDT